MFTSTSGDHSSSVRENCAQYDIPLYHLLSHVFPMKNDITFLTGEAIWMPVLVQCHQSLTVFDASLAPGTFCQKYCHAVRKIAPTKRKFRRDSCPG